MLKFNRRKFSTADYLNEQNHFKKTMKKKRCDINEFKHRVDVKGTSYIFNVLKLTHFFNKIWMFATGTIKQCFCEFIFICFLC